MGDGNAEIRIGPVRNKRKAETQLVSNCSVHEQLLTSNNIHPFKEFVKSFFLRLNKMCHLRTGLQVAQTCGGDTHDLSMLNATFATVFSRRSDFMPNKMRSAVTRRTRYS